MSSLNIELAFKEAGKLKGISQITELKMPIVIPATDLISSREIVFTNDTNLKGEEYIYDIELAKAVRASATFPGMYGPFEYKEFQFIDGGIFNNLPVKEVSKTGVDKVIAVKFNVRENKKNNTMYNIIMQTVDIITDNLMTEQCKVSDYLINIDLRGVRVFNTGKLDFCYEEGYRQTIEQMREIKQCLELDQIA